MQVVDSRQRYGASPNEIGINICLPRHQPATGGRKVGGGGAVLSGLGVGGRGCAPALNEHAPLVCPLSAASREGRTVGANLQGQKKINVGVLN